MDTVCGSCGEQNPPETQFCWSCRAYLGWQSDAPEHRTPPVTGPTPIIVPPTDEPPTSTTRADEGREPFQADVESPSLTLPTDGTPVTLVVTVSNTSTVVDGYVVEGLNAPPWLEVRPGTIELLPSTSGSVTAELRIVSSTLVPAQVLPLLVRFRNTTGRFAYRDMSVQVTVPAVEAPFDVRAEPQLLRLRDGSPAQCTVVVTNPHSNRTVRVALAASDAEQVVRATWQSPHLEVPPGGEARTLVRFDAPPPEPGGEVNRAIAVTAAEGDRRAGTTVTLAQSASRPPIEMLALHLDPTVLRLGGRRQGRLVAVVDNRAGTAPAHVSLRGDDPENQLGFVFRPPTLQVPPGQRVPVQVTVTAPRTPPGKEVTHPMTVAASDGRAEISAQGSVVQLVSSRRGLLRVLLTVLGGAAMIVGTLLPFVADSPNSGVELSAQVVSREVDRSHPEFGIPNHLDALGFEDAVSIGLVLILLGVIAIFGLTGRSGRLTRIAALIGAAVLVATFVGSATLADGSGPDYGAFLVLAGCVTAYVGGLLATR